MPLTVHKIPGQQPRVWDRAVIFFANLVSLFYGNKEETQELQKEVGTLETYGARMIPLLNLIFRQPDNLLVLERQPPEALLHYFQESLQLTIPQIKVIPPDLYAAMAGKKHADQARIDESLKAISSHPTEWLDGYVTDDSLVAIAQKVGKKTVSPPEGSRKGNNKLLLHQFLEDGGAPVFDTYVAANFEEALEKLNKLKEMGYHKAVVKSQIGASGIGMRKIELRKLDSLKNIPDYIFYEGPCLVQGWIDRSLDGVRDVASPSVQMFVKEEEISLHDITEQILSKDSVHEGNISPPPHLQGDKATLAQILEQAQTVAVWLHSQGYRGTASTDFHVIERAGSKEVRVCEINARVTGATYPSVLASHFQPQRSWLMRNVRFKTPMEDKQILSALRKQKLLFFPNREIGVLPFNFNPNDEGLIIKGQFLFLGPTLEDTASLLNRVGDMPAIKGEFDRD